VVNEEGFQLRQVTQHPAEDLFPTWSRDGSTLYFTSNRSGSWEVWAIPAQGGTAVQVTEGGATAAQEHPDGEALYLVRPDTTGIWEIPLADTVRTFVFAAPPSDTMVTSPDSVAAPSDSVMASADSLAGRQRVVPRQVVSSLDPRDRSNWQVRRRGIYFLRRNPDADVVAFYRFSTQQVSPVFLLEGVPHEPSLSVAPEGNWFVYTRTELIESDVLLVENFE
jgi:dipeptidyl aminopeptidase/acylaminoacyl peptidase